MKTKLLFVLALFFTFLLNAQTNNWFQYAKPNVVNQMVKDGSGNYHYATDIGYIKFDNTFTVTDFKNLTSQSLPIGNATSVDVNSSNENEVAIGENERVSFWTNGVNTFTIAVNTTTPSYSPQLYYNNNNELYVFDKDREDYKIISNGTVTDKPTPGIRPQAIVENNSGTKVYFAGWNNGLWEYTKATDTWVNFTQANSNLINNVLMSLFVDVNDLLYIGGFQGLNTLDPSGTMQTCQQNVAPGNPFYFSVHGIDINSSGDVLVRSSAPNGGANFGMCVVDINACTWTNYTNNGTNCLDENSFRSVQFSSSGNEVVATKTDFSSTGTYYFTINAPTPTCTEVDFNYLGATDMFRSGGFSEVNVRKSNTPDNFEIALSNTNGVDLFDFPEEDFDGEFPPTTSVGSLPGASYDIISAGDYYIFTDSSGSFTFMDQNGPTGSYMLSIPDFSLNKTKKADIDVTGSTCTLTFSGWEGPSFDTKLYMTECDMANGSCSTPVELCSNDRDTSGPITFSCTEDENSSNFRCMALKMNNSGEIALTEEIVNPVNGTSSIVFDHDANGVISFIQTDPIFLGYHGNDHAEDFIRDENGAIIYKIDPISGKYEPFEDEGGQIEEVGTEFDGDGSVDPSAFFYALYGRVIDAGVTGNPDLLRKKFSEHILKIEGENGNRSTNESLPSDEIPESVFEGLPSDIFIYSIKTYPYSNTDYATILMTNYGILIKSSIDYSFASLVVKDEEIKNKLMLYPNPANDLVSFSDNSISKLEVFDINGRRVLKENGNSFSVKTLAKGIYIVKGQADNNITVTKKLIVD